MSQLMLGGDESASQLGVISDAIRTELERWHADLDTSRREAADAQHQYDRALAELTAAVDNAAQ